MRTLSLLLLAPAMGLLAPRAHVPRRGSRSVHTRMRADLTSAPLPADLLPADLSSLLVVEDGSFFFEVVQRAGYLALALGILVGVPVFLKQEENRRIEEKKAKRERFYAAIQGEIGELEAQNTEESLEMAADLREKLKELDAELERERIAYEVW